MILRFFFLVTYLYGEARPGGSDGEKRIHHARSRQSTYTVGRHTFISLAKGLPETKTLSPNQPLFTDLTAGFVTYRGMKI